MAAVLQPAEDTNAEMPIGGGSGAAFVLRLLRSMVTAYVSRVQRQPRHIRPAGLPQDLQLLVDAMRPARNAPLGGASAPGESLHVSFNEDGSWDVGRREGHPFGGGTFTFDGELLTFSTDPDNVTCPDKPGTYDAAFTAEGDLELNVVEDTCRERARTLTGTLVPYSP